MTQHTAPDRLKPLLEATRAQCNALDRRSHDPVEFLWSYDAPEDQEIVALVASCLAYGRVELVRRAIGRALEPLGGQPARFLAGLDPSELESLYDDFVYRMTRGADIADLLAGVHHVLADFGSLEACYAASPVAGHLSRASHFVRYLRGRRLRPELARGLRYLLPDPGDGSACKRLHLFFRWMVRGPDGVDLGIWKEAQPSDLLMPLDTHTSRLCRYLGLTSRKAVDGVTAQEVTASLRKFAPDDPLRYDFALCHLGISGRCIHRRSPHHCPGCPIEGACILPS